MNILYYGFRGTASLPVLGWILVAIGAGFLIFSFISWLYDVITNVEFVGGCAVSVLAILLGIFSLMDTRVPVVKATINNSISWTEVQKDYELLEQEGEIYTFKVKNATVDEWLLKIDNP